MAADDRSAPELNQYVAQLRLDIERERDAGRVTRAVEARPLDTGLSPDVVIDGFVARLGLDPLGSWDRIEREPAMLLAQSTLRRDLAYHDELMSNARAHELVLRFFSLFASTATFRTNATFAVLTNNSGTPWADLTSWVAISNSTFDTGVVCVDERYVGLLWVEDED